jgi:DNA helicase-2/ATP-dependent DNA helicase PcrA
MPILDLIDDPEKKAAILNKGDTLVIANPGTGKTATIAYKYLHLVESGIPQEKILCLTFTERAKAEMEERIIEMSKKAGIRLNLGKLDVFTFHGFALSYLIERVPGMPSEIVSDTERRYVLLNRLLETKAFNYGTDYISGAIIPAIAENIRFLKSYSALPETIDMAKASRILIEKRKNRQISFSEKETAKVMECFMDAFAHYERWKDRKYIDFNDLHILFLKHFNGTQYDYVLVDELQDVNKMEAKIAKISGKERFAVGDKKQAIFGFQGGAYSNFDTFKEGGKSFNLGLNRRSTQQILDYAKKFMLSASEANKKFAEELRVLRSKDRSGEKPRIIFAQDPSAAALKEIKEIAKNNKSVGIIARKNRQLDELAELLMSSGIKFKSYAGGKMSNEAKEEVSIYLRALFSEKKDDAVLGLFTPFAEIDLRKAFEVSSNKDSHTMEQIRGMLYSKEIKPGFSFIKELFNKRILPCAVSMGGEYFESVSALHNRVIGHFYEMRDGFTMQGLSAFIDIMDEGLEPKIEESGVSLLTVHKAKGMQFDAVVYIPSSSGKDSLPVFKMISESILESMGIDATEEIEGENDRVDFVAFTRAKDSLAVILNSDGQNRDEMAERYAIDGVCSQETSSETVSETAGQHSNYIEAWKYFVSKDMEKARKIIGEEIADNWLHGLAASFFAKMDHMSFSGVSQSSSDPYSYLLGRVFGLSSFSETSKSALGFGTRMHHLFEQYGRGKHSDKGLLNENERTVFSNFLKCMDDIKSKYGKFEFLDVERDLSEGVREVFGINEDFRLTGKIDAILKHGSGHLIIDYKTDKKISNDADREHRKQLEVYRKVISLADNMPLGKISYAVVYVNLKGSVNTGEIGHSAAFERRGGDKLMSAFADDARTFIGFKKAPEKFLDHVFEKGPGYFGTSTGYLFESLKREWEAEKTKLR